MTAPAWAVDIPSAAVHPTTTGSELVRPFTAQQLQQMGQEFIEQFLRQVVLALAGYFTPGPHGAAFDQLSAWAADIPILSDIIEALTGVEDGDLTDLGTFGLNLRTFFTGIDFTDPSFDLFAYTRDWIQSILAPTGKVLTEWNLTGLLMPGGAGGLTVPFPLPSDLGITAPDTPLQRFIDNLRVFLTADFTDPGFDIVDAVTDFITAQLLPSGLLAQLVGGQLPDLQAPPIVAAITAAIKQLFALPGSTDLGTPIDINAVWADVIQYILAPNGHVLTEWNLTGFIGGGLTLPYALPGDLGAPAPDTVLQRFVDNLRLFLHSDYTSPGFDIVAAVGDWVQGILAPTGKVLTEWNLTGAPSGGVSFPHGFPVTFPPSSDEPLQRFMDNLRVFLTADYLNPSFDIAGAVEDFITTHLTPSGLLAQLVGGQLPDLQAPPIVKQVIESVAGGIGAGLTDIVNRLQHLDSGSGQFDAEQLFNILNIPALGDASVPGLQAIKDAVWQAITSLSGSGITLPELMAALQTIPFGNILSPGGPANIGAGLQATWDQWISGLVGAIGTGAGLADLFNIGQLVSSQSALGALGWDILGIRNNKSLNTGFLPTSESNFSFDKVGLGPSAPTFALTQSTAITAYQRISEAADKGAVSWLGSGVNLITDAFVNIFKMDTTTGLSALVHASPNVVGLMSSTMQHNIYELASPLHVLPGEVYGIEIAVRGSGTHSVVGQQTWLPDHPTVFPRRMSAVRNSGTSAPPSTIAHSALAYSANVPFMEFAVTSGDPGVPHSPQTEFFGTVGTRTIPVPLWANTAELILVGAGGGGRQGGAFNFYGEGGEAGRWATASWIRGTDFTGTPIITITVTPGGAGGSNGLDGAGGTGGNTTVSIPGRTLSALGGAGGTSLDFGNANMYGRSPGTITYPPGQIPYAGGVQQDSSGSDGTSKGGGGAGGSDLLVQFGGTGGPGAAWLRFTSN